MPARLGLIGAGAMGGAILRGAIAAGVIDPRDVTVAEPDDHRRQAAASLGCAVSGVARHAFDAEHVLFALKPQTFPTVVAKTGPMEQPTIVMSVMAGLSSPVIRRALGTNARVIRIMPNTACRIRAGVSAVAPGEGARPGDESFALRVFGALGKVVVVEEAAMQGVTALSGSGPAYVFLLAEAMEQAGIQIGLDRHTARTLAYHTILGAGRLLTEEGDATADDLRAAVTSPGGTTAAALEVMFERELPQIVTEAIIAARDRATELDEDAAS